MNSLVFGYSNGDDFMMAVPAYDVKFYGEDKGVLLFSCGGDDSIKRMEMEVKAGAETLLMRFDLNGTLLSQLQCAPPTSAFSLSLHPAGVVSVGGYGGLVDVISRFGSHPSTLCTAS
ncbi:hypothetical protein Bca101_065598 [Brassica carinata]